MKTKTLYSVRVVQDFDRGDFEIIEDDVISMRRQTLIEAMREARATVAREILRYERDGLGSDISR